MSWRGSNTLCDWSRKRANRLKTNRALANRIFPHFKPVT